MGPHPPTHIPYLYSASLCFSPLGTLPSRPSLQPSSHLSSCCLYQVFSRTNMQTLHFPLVFSRVVSNLSRSFSRSCWDSLSCTGTQKINATTCALAFLKATYITRAPMHVRARSQLQCKHETDTQTRSSLRNRWRLETPATDDDLVTPSEHKHASAIIIKRSLSHQNQKPAMRRRWIASTKHAIVLPATVAFEWFLA